MIAAALSMKKKNANSFLVFGIIQCVVCFFFMLLPFIVYLPFFEKYSYVMNVDTTMQLSVTVNAVLAVIFALLNLVSTIVYKVFAEKIQHKYLSIH